MNRCIDRDTIGGTVLNAFVKKMATGSLVALSLLLASCVTTVSESSRNKDGRYDGNWRAEVEKPPKEYRTQKWRITCWEKEISFPFSIKGGEVAIKGGRGTGKAYINDDGEFRVVIPVLEKVENRVSNSGSLQRGTNIIVDGDLGKTSGSGRYTNAFEDLGNQGCNAKIKFTRG